ncbi:MAG: OmpW family outer membrane protein [Woeseiaceae bacterium]|nr:OmpW family outer membrane protein [Woeseiaceae bacterium]
MTKLFRILVVLAGLSMIALPAQAYEKGDWLVRVGGGMVDPKSDNSSIVSVDSGSSLIFNGTYFFTPNIGLEVLAALPFSHDIHDPTGALKLAETKHLPPTFSLQYHFNTDMAFRPYVGAGLNYTTFFDEETTDTLNAAFTLSSSSLSLDDSFGIAAQLGADFDVSDNLFLNVDIRWINIETDATVSSPDLASPLTFDVEIDPMVYSIALGWKF